MVEKKVLLIDDEKLLVKSTTMALGLFGYDVQGALSGEEGLRAAKQFGPDLILLDVMMPGMDGWQVLEKLKLDEATKQIPVIVFTAREYSDGKGLAQSKGAEDYVPKPFELEDLHSLLQEYLPSKEGA